MPSRPNFTARLRAYTPLGAAGQVIPDLGISIASTPDGPTLQATVSTVTYQSLPTDLEVAVEVFDDVAQQWVEGRDSRFVCTTQDGDERDPQQVTTLAGVGLMQWLMGKAALAGVAPLQAPANVEAAASTTTASVSGSTFTWGSHILGEGDRIRVVNSGKAKGLSTGSVYFVRNPGTSTFQVSQTVSGKIKSFGSSHAVSLQRVRTRAVFAGGTPFVKNEAISVWNAASGQNLTNGSQYYVVNPTASTIQIATKPGGIPIELVADALTIYRYLDGARKFSSQTPGQVIGDPFLEARTRGWGADASGNAQVFHSWTDAGDSNSLAWPARVDDPTVTGVAVSFQPGTSLWEMTSFMLENGWAEFASHQRTIDLFAPLTGADYSASKVIGSSATSVPKSVDLTDYATTEIVRGDGPVEVSATVARSPWGVLEVYSTASGIGSASAAKSYGNTQLSEHQSPSVGWTVTEQVSAAAWLPILDYQRGDWVSAVVGGSTQRLRVIQWSLQKSTDGTVTVSAVLQAKKRSILRKVARAAKRANGGRATLTTSTTPHESDARKAAIPANLTVTARSKSAADKSASGTLTASWAAVTQDSDGNALTGARYELVVRTDGQQDGHVVATTTALQADLPMISSGETVAVAVRAISATGTYGEASPEVEYVVSTPPVIPDPPTTPTVSSTLGSITIAWDGNLVDAIDGPHAPSTDDALAFVQVQRSTDQQTWTTEAQQLPGAGYVVDLGLTVATTYYYQLVAVSQLGVPSTPSPIASAQVVAVDTAQIDAAFTAQVTQAASNAQSAQTAASNAQNTAQQAQQTASSANTAASNAQTAAQQATSAGQAASTAAANAQTTANGKNAVTYSTAAASGSGKAIGDLWYQVDSNGHVLAQWTWAGSTPAWTANLYSGAVLTALDAGSITTGTLAAARIAAGTITGAMLVANTITAAQIAASTITASQIAANTITASQIAASTITASQLAANSVTSAAIAANTIVAGDIAANTITAAQLAATAIDAMTITGATIRTASTAKTAGGVQLDSSGLHGYNASGVGVFSLDTQGNLSLTGNVNATSGSFAGTLNGASGSFSGSITAQGGTITGTLTINGGQITAGRTTLSSSGLYYGSPSGVQLSIGASLNNGNAAGITWNDAWVTSGDGSSIGIVASTSISFQSQYDRGGGADFQIDSDGSGRIWSNAIYNRTYTTVNSNPASTDNRFMVITPNGTLGTLKGGTMYLPQVYSDSINTRAVYVASNGHLGTTSSSKRTKDLHRHLKMDDTVLDRWLGLPTWEFTYKRDIAPDAATGPQHGLVAEEVEEAGFAQLVYYDETDGPNRGRVDGFAYERMGVYNHMALKRLYSRLQDAERKLSALTGKASS